MKLLVYSSPNCHLCEFAATELEAAGLLERVEGVNIETDPRLLARYETRIPVVRDPRTGTEMGWPFTAAELRETFLES